MHTINISSMQNSKPKLASPAACSLFSELLAVPTTRRHLEGELLETYKSGQLGKISQEEKGINIIADLIQGVDEKSYKEFQRIFIFGVPMEMWRKENVKTVVVFLDQNLPNLMWFSTKSKAFLLDLTYTAIDRCQLQLERASGVKQYLILRYFQEEIPLLFRGDAEKDADKYYNLFNNYIKYNRLRQYPPFFSKIMKLYTMEEVKSNISRKHYPRDILNVTEVLHLKESRNCSQILETVFYKSRKQPLTAEVELTINEIGDYFKILHCSEDLLQVYEKYSKNRLTDKLDYLQRLMKNRFFINFLLVEQKETLEDAEMLAKNMGENINFYEFCVFIENDQINHAAQAIEVDENLPLTDYFCYSSHNTYLSGNQLTSDSKIQRYLQDLERGIKCVEIDIHNDGDTPIINHAVSDKSLCKPIDFQETIRQIAQFYSNNMDHYPIILSLQNHAKEENRYKVSNILNKYLYNKLFFISQEYPFGDPVECKTLRELKGKIIIKTDSKLAEINSFKKKATFEMKINTLKLVSPLPKFPSTSFQERYNKFQENINYCVKRREEFDRAIPNSLFLPISEMTKVTGLFKSQKGIENSSSVGYQCTSITNEKAAKVKEEKIVDYTKRSFLRIYPSGTEISSSNYDPVPHLKIGAQIIALNTQTKDDNAWMLMSYFKAGRSNDHESTGYIQKPEHLRTKNPKAIIKKTFKIEVISKIQPVSIQFFGSERDKKVISKNSSIFEVVDHDESFLMFKIGSKLRECLPLRFIREGYRVLVAKNSLFIDSGIRIIIHITTFQQKFD